MIIKAQVSKPTQCVPIQRGLLQRKCACGGTPGLTGECEECRKNRMTLQRRAATQPSTFNPQPSEVPPIVHEVLRSPGQPLDAKTRAFMEPRFGHDFSRVRIHTDARAGDSARGLKALAYTVGRNVVFGKAQYLPGTEHGNQLLAHELVHVLQQSMASQDSQSGSENMLVDGPTSSNEHAAELVSRQILNRHDGIRYNAELTLPHRIRFPAIPETGSPTSVLQRQPASVAQTQEDQRRYNLTIGTDVLTNVTVAEAIRALRRLYNRIDAMTYGGEYGHRALRQIRHDQFVVGFFADTLGGVSMPPLSIWAIPRIALNAARSTLDGGLVEPSARNLVRAEQAYQEANRRFVEYREGTISGAETSVTVLRVTAAAGALAATVATGGAAAGAGASLLGTSAAVGVAGGTYGATQEFAGQVGERGAGLRRTFDLGAILRRGATDAVTNFVGALAGRALSRYATRLFGSYLSNIGDDVLRELGEQLGLRGPLPRDFFLTQGQRFIADFLGGIGASPLTTAVSTIVNRITGGGPLPSARQFAQMVIEEMVRGGIIQVFLGAFLHAHSTASASRGRGSEFNTSRTTSSGGSFGEPTIGFGREPKARTELNPEPTIGFGREPRARTEPSPEPTIGFGRESRARTAPSPEPTIGFGREARARTEPNSEPTIGFGREPRVRSEPSAEPTIGFGRQPRGQNATPVETGAGGAAEPQSVQRPLQQLPQPASIESASPPTQRERAGISGQSRVEPIRAMAGKRRVGTEDTKGARPSTLQDHQIGQSRKQRQNAAADLRNALARQEALLSRLRQLAEEFARIIRNQSSGVRSHLNDQSIPLHDRFQRVRQELSRADLERIETLRTQLRRELGIRGAAVDDYILNHLDELGLLPAEPD